MVGITKLELMNERKKIAIVGGGGAGLITAFLLQHKYDVTVFEKQPILGGNVRTLNNNVKGTKLPSNINIENGVLGFSQKYYPNFHALLKQLQVEYTAYKPSISLFSKRQFYPARMQSYLNVKTLFRLLKDSDYRTEVLKLANSQNDLEEQIRKSATQHLTFSDFVFNQKLFENYTRALFMLSFSTPFKGVDQLPQTILNDYYLSLPDSSWSFIKGGVYSYMKAILKQSNFKVVCSATDINIVRKEKNIHLKSKGENLEFDKVIVATTPGSVKHILADLTENEKEIFEDWENQNFKTIAHTDTSFYGDNAHVRKTPMDLFYNYRDNTIGYNTYQNRGYHLPKKTAYCFAYGLDSLIHADKILDVQEHIVPKYTTDHDLKISKIKHINGNNNTFFVGAYLDNGLHEGAVNSALTVSKMLNGDLI